jgi:hypothetical protein
MLTSKKTSLARNIWALKPIIQKFFQNLFFTLRSIRKINPNIISFLGFVQSHLHLPLTAQYQTHTGAPTPPDPKTLTPKDCN